MITLLNVLLLIGTLIAILMAVLAYTSQTHWSIKASTLPLLLIIGLLSFSYYQDMLGKPIQSRPEGEWQYMHHTITINENIVVWLWEEDSGHRMFEFPYNREEAKEMAKSKEETKEGQTILLNFNSNDGQIDRIDKWTEREPQFIKK